MRPRLRKRGDIAVRAGLVLLLAGVLVAPPIASGHAEDAAAPSAEKLASARDVLQATGAVKKLDVIIEHLADQMRQSLLLKKPDQAKAIEQVIGDVTERFKPRKSELVDRIAKVYASRLSLADLKAVAQFYRSEAGARFAALLPEITKEAWQAGQSWSADIGRDMEAAARLEFDKRGITF
ncbi:MAG: DUF2059 domain-containing protein [Hyphomicrobiaceae bacterium]